MLQDLANRQGLDENIYFQVFVEIICMGIKEFERYRQNIIRKIDVKNKIISPNKSPVSDRVAKSPKSIKNLTPDDIFFQQFFNIRILDKLQQPAL